MGLLVDSAIAQYVTSSNPDFNSASSLIASGRKEARWVRQQSSVLIGLSCSEKESFMEMCSGPLSSKIVGKATFTSHSQPRCGEIYRRLSNSTSTYHETLLNTAYYFPETKNDFMKEGRVEKNK